MTDKVTGVSVGGRTVLFTYAKTRDDAIAEAIAHFEGQHREAGEALVALRGRHDVTVFTQYGIHAGRNRKELTE